MRKVNTILAPGLALVCLLLAGCGKESKTIKIAVQMPLSGPALGVRRLPEEFRPAGG